MNYDALNLVQFYNVPPETVSVYLFPFAFGNLLGPILLGQLFDSIGRKTMITLTYAVSGVLLAVTGYLFQIGVLNALTQTIAWSIIFFIASAAASSAYLTVSEIFPLEIRGLAIAIFYAFGTLAGAIAPAVFGAIIGSGSRTALFWAYCFAGAVMVVAAIVEAFLGVKAERHRSRRRFLRCCNQNRLAGSFDERETCFPAHRRRCGMPGIKRRSVTVLG